MSLKKIKIMTLNIQNYHNFEERKPKIISMIKKYGPDIVAFQEIRDDRSKNEPEMNQAKQLNSDLGFKHISFLPTMDMNKVKGITGRPACNEGIAILSRYPFTSEEIALKKNENDQYIRKILVADVDVSGRHAIIFVVHFSPNDIFAKLHAEETLSHAMNLRPIILGDFNIKSSHEIEELAKKYNYTPSTEYDYISYPADGCSYDYVLVPVELSFLRFECVDEEVSDHKALFAEIRL